MARADEEDMTIEVESLTRHVGGRIRQLKLKLANGYRNDRFGTASEPSYGMGAILGVAFPLMFASYQLLVRRSFIGAILNGRRAPKAAAKAAPDHAPLAREPERARPVAQYSY